MAKTRITVESDFDELVADMLRLAEDFPEVILEAADAQLEVFEDRIKRNWTSMVPWANPGDYVYDSIGRHVENVKGTGDTVGMAGVFLLDAVNNKHGKEKKDIKAPQLAYWVEFGYAPNHGAYQQGIPFMANAYHATLHEQDKVFADTLSMLISKRLSQ